MLINNFFYTQVACFMYTGYMSYMSYVSYTSIFMNC